jgi:hypothetical protein
MVNKMQAGLKNLARDDCQSEEAYKNLVQLAVKESETPQKEHLMVLSKLQSKKQLLANLTNKICSI